MESVELVVKQQFKGQNCTWYGKCLNPRLIIYCLLFPTLGTVMITIALSDLPGNPSIMDASISECFDPDTTIAYLTRGAFIFESVFLSEIALSRNIQLHIILNNLNAYTKYVACLNGFQTIILFIGISGLIIGASVRVQDNPAVHGIGSATGFVLLTVYHAIHVYLTIVQRKAEKKQCSNCGWIDVILLAPLSLIGIGSGVVYFVELILFNLDDSFRVLYIFEWNVLYAANTMFYVFVYIFVRDSVENEIQDFVDKQKCCCGCCCCCGGTTDNKREITKNEAKLESYAPSEIEII